jgi:protein-L-isoaspartate(D-aspartate) O-methyltransferase
MLELRMSFDKIFVGGSLPEINEHLKNQLKIGGRLVGVVGSVPIMHAISLEKISEDEYRQTQLFETYVDELVSPAYAGFKF